MLGGCPGHDPSSSGSDVPATGHGLAILEAPRPSPRLCLWAAIHRQGCIGLTRCSPTAACNLHPPPNGGGPRRCRSTRRSPWSAPGRPASDGPSSRPVNPSAQRASAASTVQRCGPAAAMLRGRVAYSDAAKKNEKPGQSARGRRGTAAPVCRLPFVGPGAARPPAATVGGPLERTLRAPASASGSQESASSSPRGSGGVGKTDDLGCAGHGPGGAGPSRAAVRDDFTARRLANSLGGRRARQRAVAKPLRRPRPRGARRAVGH